MYLVIHEDKQENKVSGVLAQDRCWAHSRAFITHERRPTHVLRPAAAWLIGLETQLSQSGCCLR